MVGIVVVSHSRALAGAAVALAEEMLPGRELRIAVAAGLDDTTSGTDAVQIREAITLADGGDGVIVLMDLGSAVLSAELALDLLDDEPRGRVVLSPAPLVEGLIVAAVAAAAGATLEEAAAEAAGALAGKQSHLQVPAADVQAQDAAVPNGVDAGELVGTFTVSTPHGLHARPAARLVHEVRGLDARVLVRNLTTRSQPVSASSLSKVATLGALSGHQVEVRVTGRQAREALEHVLALAGRQFDEAPGDGAVAGPVAERAAQVDAAGPDAGRCSSAAAAPLAASPGIGIGPAWSLRPAPLDVPDTRTDDPTGEWRGLREAIGTVHRDLQRVRARVAREVGEADAAIFDAHMLLLDDPDLLADVRSRIDGDQAAAPAWAAAIARIGAELAAVPDPYLRSRAADVGAVGEQVLRALLGVSAAIDASAPLGGSAGVLVAADLTPNEVTELDRDRVAAIVLADGSPTSHSAILARARGIPAVVGAGPDVLGIADGTVLAVDGSTGEVVVDPAAGVLKGFRRRATDLADGQRQALAGAALPAVTRDGVQVLVGANIGSVEDARAAAASGADLAGLVRTEFLFLGRAQAPDVDEQVATYRQIAEAMGGRRLTLRTLDIGGDKPLGYLPMPAEANPFLGVRGIRLSLARPQLLADQLLAIVVVAHDVPVSLMFPMVSTLAELTDARRMLDDAVKLAGRGEPAALQVGIMVEIPATALRAHAFAPHVDFLSIGTNDLTQYALAAERGNRAVAGIADPFDPGLLRLVDATCRGAGDRALLCVCGEMAADERAAALLVGFGVRELSVAPRAVPAIKQAVRGLDLPAAASLAASALDAEDVDGVHALLAETLLTER